MKLKATIFARTRPEATPDNRPIVALRWALTAGFGVGADCFALYRTIDANPEERIWPKPTGRVGAPGATPGTTAGTWTINRARLVREAQTRETSPEGNFPVSPIFGRGTDVGELDVLILFALTNPDFVELDNRIENVITTLGALHLADAGLAARYWPRSSAPDLAKLLDWKRSANSADQARYRAVRRFYRRESRKRLDSLALDFGFARFLGVGIDDVLPLGTARGAQLRYRLTVEASPSPVETDCTLWLYPDLLRRPDYVETNAVDGWVGHAMFETFLEPGSTWKPPVPDGLPGSLAVAARLSAQGRSSPAKIGQIKWNTKPREGVAVGTRGLSINEAVFWNVERFDFGPQTANDPEPGVDSGFPFRLRNKNRRFAVERLRGAPPPIATYLDDPAPRYGEPKMIGWFAYRVAGVDLFGIPGWASDPALFGPARENSRVLLRDEIGPPPPHITIDVPRIEYPSRNRRVRVPITIGWDDALEFMAPDAANFHLSAAWRGTKTLGVEIRTAEACAVAASLLADVQLVMRGAANVIPWTDLQDYLRKRLIVDGIEFVITVDEPAAGYSLRVRQSKMRLPPKGPALLQATPREPLADIKIEPRRPARPVALATRQLDPLILALDHRDNGGAVAAEEAALYIHLFHASLPIIPTDHGHFRIDETSLPGDLVTLLAEWRGLGEVAAKAFLDGSPGLVLPTHHVELDLTVPAGCRSGLFEIAARGADDAIYMNGGVGNLGPIGKSFIVPFVMTDPPAAIDKVQTVWADGSGEYRDYAEVTLHWKAIAGAKRYEIDCVLEPRLGLPAGSSDQLLLRTAEQAEDKLFTRITNACLSNQWTDRLPGRAPTRAIYRARAISDAEVPGPWALIALVRVPDTRIAAPPNLLPVRRGSTERSLSINWTQPGDLDGLGFAIETRSEADAPAGAELGWRVSAEYSPTMLVPGRGSTYAATLVDLAPGTRWQVRVAAIRHAPDPIDPWAKRTRQIRGRPSAISTASTVGSLRPPDTLSVQQRRDGNFLVSWANRDPYVGLELHVRRPEARNFERVALAADEQLTIYQPGIAEKGLWQFKLLAWASGINGASAVHELEVS